MTPAGLAPFRQRLAAVEEQCNVEEGAEGGRGQEEVELLHPGGRHLCSRHGRRLCGTSI